jgi:hypothetical protein
MKSGSIGGHYEKDRGGALRGGGAAERMSGWARVGPAGPGWAPPRVGPAEVPFVVGPAGGGALRGWAPPRFLSWSNASEVRTAWPNAGWACPGSVDS